MVKPRDDEWTVDSLYTEGQIELILENIGVEIVSNSFTHFIAYCPYHGNHDTPAFEVNKTLGLFLCFSPSCGESGTLEKLVKDQTQMNQYQARRFILGKATEGAKSAEERVREALAQTEDLPHFPQQTLDRLKEGYWQSDEAQAYMTGRGFSPETTELFDVGFSTKRDLISIPMHDIKGNPIGVIGRGIHEKVFKNSKQLPKADTMFNMHRARGNDQLIIVEASFDAMAVTQAGFHNVAATLGGQNFSIYHINQVMRNFSGVVIMTDNDKTRYEDNGKACRKCYRLGFNECAGHKDGRRMGRLIERALPGKRIRWASYDDGVVFPHGAKDATDMLADPGVIRQCVRNCVSSFEYNSWGIDAKGDSLDIRL